jgi:hypothetical protein
MPSSADEVGSTGGNQDMPKLKGSKTETNLLTAFAGESQARNRYTFFASAAKNEGLQQISTIFEETANQEKEHTPSGCSNFRKAARSLQAGEEGGVALQKLRLPARGNGGPRGLSRMRPSPGALRAAGRELVANSELGEEQPRPC